MKNTTNEQLFNFTHDAMKHNLNDERIELHELERLKQIVEQMNEQYENDDYGITNAFMTNLLNTIEYKIKQRNE